MSYAGGVWIGPYTFRRLARAWHLLTCAAYDHLSVRTVAQTVGLSPFHFIRQFRALYGVTPHQLRTEARLERARQLLARGATVTEACMGVGFKSLGSFSTLFTRRTGLSPVHYRRSLQRPGTISAPVVPGCFGLMGQVSARNFREVKSP